MTNLLKRIDAAIDVFKGCDQPSTVSLLEEAVKEILFLQRKLEEKEPSKPIPHSPLFPPVGRVNKIGVVPGDVIECVAQYGCHTVGRHYSISDNLSHKDDKGDVWTMDCCPSATFKIVSRKGW